MDGASLSHSVSSSSTRLDQVASAFCEVHDHIHFQSPDYAESSSHSSEAKDTLLSVGGPHLRRNRWFNEKSNDTSYCSQLQTTLSSFHQEPQKQTPNIKTRVKWIADLHEKFVDCVNLLGGAEKATPRAILKLMKSNGLTVLHVKSHLQKYRYAKYTTDSATPGKRQQQAEDRDDLLTLYLKGSMQVKEILQIQQEVRDNICQQLQIQQNIHQSLGEQAKQIEMMLGQLKKQK